MKRLAFAALLTGSAALSLPARAQEPTTPETKPGVTRPADDGKAGVTRPGAEPDAQHGTHGGGSSAPT
jgi:hypothetical protein